MLSRTQPRAPSNPHATLAELQQPIIDAFLASLPSGRVPRIVGSRSVFVAETRAEALHLADIGLRKALGRFIERGHRMPGDSLADIIRAFDVHVGTPAEVIDSLLADPTLMRRSRRAVALR
jgi:alkanesulfonate monooxygenase SsuD/methylene tetrahydromethanopterin reductase-like flavin-dependent oxidoreductase (luciferase family)